MEFQSVYLAPFKLEDVLLAELGPRVFERRDRLFLVRGKDPAYFVQNVWQNPQFHEFNSISQAAKFLKAIQRNWALYSTGHHRRAQLIADQLPPVKAKKLEAYAPLPKAPLGSWTLWDERTLLYSADCSSPFAHGEVEFQEDKIQPPSRAYLKLWEYFLLTQRWPQPGDHVLDLGSSPGGWTWALDQLGCQVTSVDKAPLAEGLRLSERVRFLGESAFALSPVPVDWLFSDVICYPSRLFELIQSWRGFARNIICTIKFQGETDFTALRRFGSLEGGSIRHLFHNKHELTFSLCQKPDHF